MNLIDDKPLTLAAAGQDDEISRRMLAWVNDYPELPVDIVRFEYLAAETVSMALSTIQSAYITKRYICGGYEAEYQFKVILRIHPNETSSDQRLKAVELLNRFGDWAMTNTPDLGDGLIAKRVEPTTRADLFARYEGGDEDYQIIMKLTCEVI